MHMLWHIREKNIFNSVENLANIEQPPFLQPLFLQSLDPSLIFCKLVNLKQCILCFIYKRGAECMKCKHFLNLRLTSGQRICFPFHIPETIAY